MRLLFSTAVLAMILAGSALAQSRCENQEADNRETPQKQSVTTEKKADPCKDIEDAAELAKCRAKVAR